MELLHSPPLFAGASLKPFMLVWMLFPLSHSPPLFAGASSKQGLHRYAC